MASQGQTAAYNSLTRFSMKHVRYRGDLTRLSHFRLPPSYIKAMDYVTPHRAAPLLAEAGAHKVESKPSISLLRGLLASAVLSIAVTFACLVTAETKVAFDGALVFPAGFAIIVVTGLELFTATSATAAVAAIAGRVSWQRALRASALVYAGNFIGGLLLALMIWGSLTTLGNGPQPQVAQRLIDLSILKTKYDHFGAAGLTSAFIKGILCNFMLCAGVLLATLTESVIGKLASAWVAAVVFFGLGLEHCVINMFLIPAGMLFGAEVSLTQFLFWNMVPVTLGNALGGALILAPFWWINSQKTAHELSHASETPKPITPPSEPSPDPLTEAA